MFSSFLWGGSIAMFSQVRPELPPYLWLASGLPLREALDFLRGLNEIVSDNSSMPLGGLLSSHDVIQKFLILS